MVICSENNERTCLVFITSFARFSNKRSFGGLSLDRVGPAERDVEVADGWHQHRHERETVDTRAHQERGHHVTVDQTDDAVEGPERRQDRDQA